MPATLLNKIGTINKDYYNLDLLLNEQFYQQFDPLIITLNTPIHYQEDKNQSGFLLPEHTVSKFIVRKKHFQKFLKTNTSFVLEKPNTQARHEISINDISFDLENNSQLEVLRILNEPKVLKQTDIFLINGNTFIDIAGYHHKKFFIPAAISALTERGMSKETFLEFVSPDTINMSTFRSFTAYEEKFDLMKKNLGKDFAPFFMKIALNLAQVNSGFNTVQISDDVELFSEQWLKVYEQIDEEKSNLMLLFKSPQWELSKKEYLEYSANLILAKSQRCSEHNFENTILKNLAELESQELNYIINKLDRDKDFEKMGQRVKEQVEEWYKAKQPKEELISKDGKVRILREIPWQQITVEKFNRIPSDIKSPKDFHDNMKIKLDELCKLYSNYRKNVPVLVKMFELLQETRKSVDLWCGLDDYDANYNAKQSVYINEKGLFIELSRDNNDKISNETLHKIVDIAISHLTVEKIADYDSLNKEIGNVIIQSNMKNIENNNEQQIDDEAEQHTFKI